MNFLFLDIDGVLNAHESDPEVLCGQIHRDKVQRLNRILRETGAMIVLSSAWRYIIHRGEANLMGMEWLLRSHGVLAGRLVGITRKDTMERRPYTGDPKEWPQENERGRQISDWIVGEGWAAYGEDGRHVVIDDLDLGITEAGHPFVKTDGNAGLTETDAERAIELFWREGDPPKSTANSAASASRIRLGIAGRLKRARTEAGLTLREVEAATGISNAAISQAENGRVVPSAAHLYVLARRYGRRPDWFFEGIEGTSEDDLATPCPMRH